MKITEPKQIVQPYITELKGLLGSDLLSVIIYGSAATVAYRPGKSDINLLVVLVDSGIDKIHRVATIDKRWRKKGVSTPFFMTPAYIDASLDTYPVEFLSMKQAYWVVFGPDPLATLKIKPEYVRLECERELKGIAVHLRRGYVSAGSNVRTLEGVLQNAMRSLLPIMRSILSLHGLEIPVKQEEIIAAIEGLYQLSPSVLSEVGSSGFRKNFARDSLGVYSRFTAQIDILSNALDTMNKGWVA